MQVSNTLNLTQNYFKFEYSSQEMQALRPNIIKKICFVALKTFHFFFVKIWTAVKLLCHRKVDIFNTIICENKKWFEKALDDIDINQRMQVEGGGGIGGTILHDLAKWGKPLEWVEILKKRGIDFTVQDDYGNTALMWAIANGQNDMAMEILKQGKDLGINKQDCIDFEEKNLNWQNSALHLAVGKGYRVWNKEFERLGHTNAMLMKTIIDLGADVNIKNARGNTPLHLAFLRRDLVMISYLVEHGARMDLRNKQNETPEDQLRKSYKDAKHVLKNTVYPCLIDKEAFQTNLDKIQLYLAQLKP